MTTTAGSTELLRTLADDFWETLLAANPVWATTLGDRRFDDRNPDHSPAATARHIADLEALRDRAAVIDPQALSDAERVTLSMLRDEIGRQSDLLATGIDEWTVDHLMGPQVAYFDLVDVQTIRSTADADAMVARWRGIGEVVDQAIANLRRSRAEGRVAPRAPVERAIAVIRSYESKPIAEWKLVEPVLAPGHGLDDGAVAALREGLRDAVAEDAAPAFRRYREVLETEILPAARPDELAGLGNVPGGDDAYRALIRVHTSLDAEAEAIHRIGLAEIERIDAGFVELGHRVLGTSDLRSTLAALRADPALRFETADEVFATAKRSLARAQAALTPWFGTLPQAVCTVLPIPAHAQEHQTLAYYLEPALDGSRPGRYYVNLHAPETRPRFEAEALAFHESVPGHHLQLSIANELDGIPAFQKVLGATAFIEGWGLYAERLADDMGLYTGDLDRFGILSFDAWRAGRLVVDTGLHALGWSRERAIAFLRDHTALGDNNIENEVDRYIVWPGQALAYKLGQLEILGLREESRTALGSSFDIRAFHDVVLGSGAVSLRTLRANVEAWVERGSAAPRAKPPSTPAPG